MSETMSSAIELLSIGKAADFLARAIRWSPIGRTVVLHGAEGPSANMFAGLAGVVDSVDDSGAILIGQARQEIEDQAGTVKLRLIPRHKGWTAFSLMLVQIAVVAELVGSDGRAHSVTIAIASIGSRRG
jgi:phage gp37-like protein